MRYDSEHKDRTHKKVLVEAAAAIREVGPDRIGVADLMAKAGLTHGGFYAHFKSKDHLVAEAVSEMFEEMYERYSSWTRASDPREGLTTFIDRYLSTRHRDEPGRGCPMAALAGDFSRLPVAARKRFAAGATRLIGSIAGLLGQLGLPDPDRLAGSMMSEMVGAVALARAVPDPAQSERILAASREAIKARIAPRARSEA